MRPGAAAFQRLPLAGLALPLRKEVSRNAQNSPRRRRHRPGRLRLPEALRQPARLRGDRFVAAAAGRHLRRALVSARSGRCRGVRGAGAAARRRDASRLRRALRAAGAGRGLARGRADRAQRGDARRTCSSRSSRRRPACATSRCCRAPRPTARMSGGSASRRARTARRCTSSPTSTGTRSASSGRASPARRGAGRSCGRC